MMIKVLKKLIYGEREDSEHYVKYFKKGGMKIGDNVIIDANSLVNRDIPNDVVVAENPVKIIMSLEEYRLKRKASYVEEGKILAREYYKTYNKKTIMDVFKENFMIMSLNTKEYMVRPFLKRKNVNSLFYTTEPHYEDLDIFLKEYGIK